MFGRLVRESFVRNPRRKVLVAAALVVGMAVATSTLTIALEVGDRLAREFRSLGANLLVTPQADTLPIEIGGVHYLPVNEGAYLSDADLGKLKTIFWRHNILGFTPFLDVPVTIQQSENSKPSPAMLVGTWYSRDVPVPDNTMFKTGLSVTHPWWKVQGRWFRDDVNECVIGSALAATMPDVDVTVGKVIYVTSRLAVDSVGGQSNATQAIPLKVVGIVSTDDAEDKALLVPLTIAQK